MEVIRSAARCPRPVDGTTVTIGAYDGVHRGHQAVIDQVRTLGRARGQQSAVVTFDRHPASVVRPESGPLLLTDLDQKLELLELTEIDFALVVEFDEQRARESAEHFVESVLVDCLAARTIVVGSDFHFGHQRRGNVALLQELAPRHGFDVVGLQLVGPDWHPASPDARVSSTAIRQLLAKGQVEGAAELLGRHHEVRGRVARGDQRGRELGFPTANIEVPDRICVPADGVYAGWYIRPNGEIHPSAVNIGRRPTFYEHQPFSLIEAHVLDFDGDLYGERANLQFVARLRAEERFESVEALVEQMTADCAEARTLLADDAARAGG